MISCRDRWSAQGYAEYFFEKKKMCAENEVDCPQWQSAHPGGRGLTHSAFPAPLLPKGKMRMPIPALSYTQLRFYNSLLRAWCKNSLPWSTTLSLLASFLDTSLCSARAADSSCGIRADTRHAQHPFLFLLFRLCRFLRSFFSVHSPILLFCFPSKYFSFFS